jgi:hypothetical protein
MKRTRRASHSIAYTSCFAIMCRVTVVMPTSGDLPQFPGVPAHLKLMQTRGVAVASFTVNDVINHPRMKIDVAFHSFTAQRAAIESVRSFLLNDGKPRRCPMPIPITKLSARLEDFWCCFLSFVLAPHVRRSPRAISTR